MFQVDSATDSAQTIEEFNDILNVVCKKNNNSSSMIHNGTTGTFQDFETGVIGMFFYNIFTLNLTNLYSWEVNFSQFLFPVIAGSYQLKTDTGMTD